MKARIVLLLLATSLTRIAFAAPPLLDAPWRGYDTGVFPNGFGPQTLAAGDLDGDGDLDVVTGNSYFAGAGISVLKNNGDGSYVLDARYGVSYNRRVYDVALVDVDGDGDLDVVGTVSNDFGAENIVALWRNNGSGAFASYTAFQVGGSQPQGLVVVDVNGDGFPDVATANYNTNNVSILRHNGLAGPSAAFLPATQYPANQHPSDVAAGDLNGDGTRDLIVQGWENVVINGLTYAASTQTPLFNNGSGTFAMGTKYVAVTPPARGVSSSLTLADIDNDGDLDLITGGARDAGSISYGVIAVLRNNGSGQFGPAQEYNLENFVWTPSHFTTGDLNGDGFADIIATTPSGRADDGYNVLLSTGGGNFATPIFYPASQQTFASVAVDADGDGRRDVITVAQSSAAITVHKNPGSGLFPRPTQYLIGGFTEALDSADLDGDGDLDIVTNDDAVRILKNNGNGTFASAVTYTPTGNWAQMKLRDLNGDGRPDLLLGPDAEFPPYHFATALNNGNGTFAATVVRPVGTCGEGSIDAFDLDNDGDLDVVLTEEQGCAGGAQPRIFVFRNDGNQVFTLMPIIIPPGFAVGIAAADLNGDGKLDLVTALNGVGGIGAYLGNGDLTFQPPLVSSTAPYKFGVGDFNSDGKVDVAMLIPQDSFGTVYVATALGNGNGTFQPAQQQSGSSVLESAFRISDDIDVRDMNGDGRPDVVVTNDASNDVSVFITNADGTLRPQQRYGTGYGSRWSTLGDFNGDGVIDIANVFALPPSGFQDVVTVLRGLPGAPTATAAVSRKTHNGITLDLPLTLTGTPVIESRRGTGTNFDQHQIVVTLSSTASVGSVSASSTNGNPSASYSVAGNSVVVDLGNVATAQRVVVQLHNVSNAAGTVDLIIPVNFLLGDTSGDGSVNAADFTQTRSHSGEGVGASNYRFDVNLDGTVNSGDTTLVRSRSGASLP